RCTPHPPLGIPPQGQKTDASPRPHKLADRPAARAGRRTGSTPDCLPQCPPLKNAAGDDGDRPAASRTSDISPSSCPSLRAPAFRAIETGAAGAQGKAPAEPGQRPSSPRKATEIPHGTRSIAQSVLDSVPRPAARKEARVASAESAAAVRLPPRLPRLPAGWAHSPEQALPHLSTSRRTR